MSIPILSGLRLAVMSDPNFGRRGVLGAHQPFQTPESHYPAIDKKVGFSCVDDTGEGNGKLPR